MIKKNNEIILHWNNGDIMLFQLVDVLENFECESDNDNDVDHGDLNEISPDPENCDEDSDEDSKANDN